MGSLPNHFRVLWHKACVTTFDVTFAYAVPAPGNVSPSHTLQPSAPLTSSPRLNTMLLPLAIAVGSITTPLGAVS